MSSSPNTLSSRSSSGPSAGVGASGVDLFWLPLGAGEGTRCVRIGGGIFEAVVAARAHRPRGALYHSALEVQLDDDRFAIEITPVWGNGDGDRGVVAEGAVGAIWLGRSRFFRYEIRRWRGGAIPDVDEAVGGPRRVSEDRASAERVLELVAQAPTLTWGRDESHAGEMWNSNSLVAWLLARSGHAMDVIAPPSAGRAPGWAAGLVVAGREPAVPMS